MIIKPIFTTLIAWIFVISCIDAISPRSPIIIVPGDGGSRIYAKLDLDSAPGPFCSKTTDDFVPLWVYIKKLIGDSLECTVHNLKLVYDSVTHMTTDMPGVTTAIPGFGETYTIESLSVDKDIVEYFAKLVKAAISWGYIRGQDLRGAPYDFRKSPNELGVFYTKLKFLIEETYTINDETPVTMIGHSYGCPTTLYFLNQQSQEWKTKYIKRFISMGGPYGGTTEALKSYVAGSTVGEPASLLPPNLMAELQRTFPSSAFMLPTSQFWNQTEPLVTTPKKQYGPWNWKELFEDMKQPQLISFYRDTKYLIKNLVPPFVEVHCVYGSGVNTVGRFVYMTEFPTTAQPVQEFGLGDGTINKRSLEACLLFGTKQPQSVQSLALPGVGHVAMVKDPAVIEYVKSLVLKSEN